MAGWESNLLLQANHARPLLLQQALVLLAGDVVKRVADARFLAKGGGRVGRICNVQVGDDGFVAGGPAAVSARVASCEALRGVLLQLFGLAVGQQAAGGGVAHGGAGLRISRRSGVRDDGDGAE